MNQRQLEVVLNDQVIGDLKEVSDIWGFDYRREWLENPRSFDLSPAIGRFQQQHLDGSTTRPVQWFFDNLLPEEGMRALLSKEMNVPKADAFGLLAALGQESAGSLVLRVSGAQPLALGSKPLALDQLSERIQRLPRASLSSEAPKRMSLAGAQHKMVVFFDKETGDLAEPLPGSASSHILKPDSQAEAYPHSVVNEAFTMKLAARLRLPVPEVHMIYAPEPVYIIDRFDRFRTEHEVEWQRKHVLDACQLLSLSSGNKYNDANVETLRELSDMCRSKASTRLLLYRWLVFNTLVGNSDAHLKNLSFLVTGDGIALAPFYDLLSTSVYVTPLYADSQAIWPREPLHPPIPGASVFDEVSKDKMLAAGEAIGIGVPAAKRILEEMVGKLLSHADALIEEFLQGRHVHPASRAPSGMQQGSEAQMLRAIRYVVIATMVQKLR